MANQWFRSWHGAPTDTKWLAIAKRAGVAAGIVSAIAWALFDHASQQEDRGSIDGFDQEGYAAFSGFEEQQIGATIIALKEKGLIENNHLKSWSRRQPAKEDFNAKDRKRKQRDQEKKEDVTPCHTPSRDVTTDKTRLDKDNKELEGGALAPAPTNISKITKRGSRLPTDWDLPTEWGEWALKEGLTRQQVLNEEDSFRDYWIAKSGKDAVKVDWEATWRSWIRKSKEFGRVKV